MKMIMDGRNIGPIGKNINGMYGLISLYGRLCFTSDSKKRKGGTAGWGETDIVTDWPK